MSVEMERVHAPAVVGQLPEERWRPSDEIRVLVNPVGDQELDGTEEVLLTFTAGEMWAAINVLARELGVTPASALAGCVSYGLITLGFDIEPPLMT